MKLYYYLPKAAFYAFSIMARSEKEARQAVRSILNKNTLHGVQIWKG